MKSPHHPSVRRDMNMRLDRHSGTGTRGLPKKEGAGSKTVWGHSDDQAPVTCLDKNDPNYDSGDEQKDAAAPAAGDSSAKAPDAGEASAAATDAAGAAKS